MKCLDCYKSQIDADFSLYKGQRDNYDALKAEIDSLKCQVAVDGIVTEEIEIINSIDNYDFTIPFIGDGNISRGNVTLSIPFINKGIVFNQSDLETFRQLLIQE